MQDDDVPTYTDTHFWLLQSMSDLMSLEFYAYKSNAVMQTKPRSYISDAATKAASEI